MKKQKQTPGGRLKVKQNKLKLIPRSFYKNIQLRLNFPSSPLSAPGSPRMNASWLGVRVPIAVTFVIIGVGERNWITSDLFQ